jgi:hypothetical protein
MAAQVAVEAECGGAVELVQGLGTTPELEPAVEGGQCR